MTQPISNVISGVKCCISDCGTASHCKSCPYDSLDPEKESCEDALARDILVYLTNYEELLEKVPCTE